jgi:hypothetical protein
MGDVNEALFNSVPNAEELSKIIAQNRFQALRNDIRSLVVKLLYPIQVQIILRRGK